MEHIDASDIASSAIPWSEQKMKWKMARYNHTSSSKTWVPKNHPKPADWSQCAVSPCAISPYSSLLYCKTSTSAPMPCTVCALQLPPAWNATLPVQRSMKIKWKEQPAASYLIYMSFPAATWRSSAFPRWLWKTWWGIIEQTCCGYSRTVLPIGLLQEGNKWRSIIPRSCQWPIQVQLVNNLSLSFIIRVVLDYFNHQILHLLSYIFTATHSQPAWVHP